jgi:hypothetical protein
VALPLQLPPAAQPGGGGGSGSGFCLCTVLQAHKRDPTPNDSDVCHNRGNLFDHDPILGRLFNRHIYASSTDTDVLSLYSKLST